MLNLLTAELHRVRRDPICWLLLAASALCGVFFSLMSSAYYFEDMDIIPFYVVLAIFISLSIGREYADGTIRNKIIVGKSKSLIFLSKLVSGIGISLCLTLAFLLPCAILLYKPVLSVKPALVLVRLGLGFTLLNLAWAVLFTVVSSLISAKGVGGIINLVLIFAMLVSSEYLRHGLKEPEYLPPDDPNAYTLPMTTGEIEQIENDPFAFEGFVMCFEDADGTLTYRKADPSKVMENPHYIKPPLRAIVSAVNTALPYEHVRGYVACLEADAVDEHLRRIESFPLYDALLILVFSGCGFVLFRKKEFR